MPFGLETKEEALVRSRRSCCICHRFVGRSAEVHHIHPEAAGGQSDLSNAIVLCPGCHSEAGHYNPKHPRGNKYSPSELVRHRDEWWKWCSENPRSPIPSHPIGVSPTEISLGTKGYPTLHVVKLNNKTTDVLHEILVMIRPNSHAVNLRSIEVKPVSPKMELVGLAGNIEVYWDLLRLDIEDQQGKAIALVLASLNPGETAALRISSAQRDKSFAERHPRAVLEVADFNDSPKPTIMWGNATAHSFMIPGTGKYRLLSGALALKRCE